MADPTAGEWAAFTLGAIVGAGAALIGVLFWTIAKAILAKYPPPD